jgi:hypothetical protein
MTDTSRKSIIARLRREGFGDVADSVERGEISAFAIACELGWARRHNVSGRGSENQAKRRAFALKRVLGEYGST